MEQTPCATDLWTLTVGRGQNRPRGPHGGTEPPGFACRIWKQNSVQVEFEGGSSPPVSSLRRPQDSQSVMLLHFMQSLDWEQNKHHCSQGGQEPESAMWGQTDRGPRKRGVPAALSQSVQAVPASTVWKVSAQSRNGARGEIWKARAQLPAESQATKQQERHLGSPRLTTCFFFPLLSHFIDKKTKAQRWCNCTFKAQIVVCQVDGWNWALLESSHTSPTPPST